MSGRAVYILFLLLSVMRPAAAQETAQEFDKKLQPGAYADFQLSGNASIEEVLETIYQDSGQHFFSVIAVHTEAGAFRGAFIQEKDDFIVLFEDKTPFDEARKPLPRREFTVHYIRQEDITAISADGTAR